MRVYYFEKMRVWQNARELTNTVYKITKTFPSEEHYLLTSQMRRASSSVKSNIAEGQGRRTRKDQLHFTSMSFASLIELLNHLITAKDLDYIDESTYSQVRNQIEHIGNQLNALGNSQRSKL